MLINSFVFGVAYDTDAQAYINAVEAADTAAGVSGGLEAATKDAINAFVVGCKEDGTWNAIKASCILAGARTLTGALMPLVGTAPTNFNFVSGDYNRKTGLVGDGSTKYLGSNRNRQDDPQNSQHTAVYLTAAPNNATVNWLFGAGGGGGGVGATHLAANSATFVLRHSANTGIVPEGTDNALTTPTLVGINRAIASEYKYHRNSSTRTISNTSDGRINANFLIFTTTGATSGAQLADARISFYSIGESINLALLDARVTALITAISTAF